MVTSAHPNYQKSELFYLNNDWRIEIYYGFINDPQFPDNDKFINMKTRLSGVLMEVKLFKDNILIDNQIEANPGYCSHENKIKHDAAWQNKGNEFERKIYFDNGYMFKIEYWFSKNKQEPNRGIYHSEFRKLILYNQNKEKISEIIEKNPNYINPEIINEFDYSGILN